MSEARTLWEEGHEPGRQVVALGLALVLTVVTAEVLVGGRVGVLFDVAFVLVCLLLAGWLFPTPLLRLRESVAATLSP